MILFAPEAIAPIHRVSASGGNSVAITKLETAQSTSHRWPFFLPDGKHYFYFDNNTRDASADAVYYASLDGRENHPVVPSHSNAIYSSGFLIFMRASTLMAQPFDPASGTLGGEAQNLNGGVTETPAPGTWTPPFLPMACSSIATVGTATNRWFGWTATENRLGSFWNSSRTPTALEKRSCGECCRLPSQLPEDQSAERSCR